MENKGKYLEELVHWVNKCLHSQNAEIKLNDKILDKQSGTKREVDISIKIQDGPTKILAIIEVRDRNRPVGQPYIEQVKAKADAIGANIVYVVSKSGFASTAIKKAKFSGVELIDFKEALKKDWSTTIRHLESITIYSIGNENTTIYFLDKDTKKIINMHDDLIKRIKESNNSEKCFVNSNKQPFMSLIDIFNTAISAGNEALYKNLNVGKNNKKKMRLFVEFNPIVKVYFLDYVDEYREINFILIVGDFWIIKEIVPTTVKKYQSPDKENYAELLSTQDSKTHNIEILIENPGDISNDRKMHIRIKPKKA